jgi:hypothetical protein
VPLPGFASLHPGYIPLHFRRTAMRQRVTIEQLSADVLAGGGLPGRTTRSA